MKRILIGMVALTTSVATIFAGESAERIAIKDKAKAQALFIVRLAKDAKDTRDMKAHIRVSEVSGVKRHAATPDNVRKWFCNIDVNKVKTGRIDWFAERRLVIVRIDEPIRCDLEFYVGGSEQSDIKLQAIHP